MESEAGPVGEEGLRMRWVRVGASGSLAKASRSASYSAVVEGESEDEEDEEEGEEEGEEEEEDDFASSHHTVAKGL